MAFVITEPCIDALDKKCVAVCPADCIYEGDRMLYIHPDECIDCGACETECPREAIYAELEVPRKWRAFKQANRDFFDTLGLPGGAGKVGRTSNDPEFIRNFAGRTDQ